MASETKPGDGRNSPFGDGAGGTGVSSMANGTDFSTNPGGAGFGRPAPPDFTRTSRQQQQAGQRTNTSDAAAGPANAAEVVNRPSAGVGSVGNAAKPYRLGGG